MFPFLFHIFLVLTVKLSVPPFSIKITNRNKCFMDIFGNLGRRTSKKDSSELGENQVKYSCILPD